MRNLENGRIPQEAQEFKAPLVEPPKNKFKKLVQKIGRVAALGAVSLNVESQAQAGDWQKISQEARSGIESVGRVYGDVKDAGTRRKGEENRDKADQRRSSEEKARIDADERVRITETAERGGWGDANVESKADQRTGRTSGVKISVNKDTLTGTPHERMENERNRTQVSLEKNRQASDLEMQNSRQKNREKMARIERLRQAGLLKEDDQ